jgi:hypothetical protein
MFSIHTLDFLAMNFDAGGEQPFHGVFERPVGSAALWLKMLR